MKNKLAEPSSPVRAINADGIPLSSKCVDVVITNPPFETKQMLVSILGFFLQPYDYHGKEFIRFIKAAHGNTY